MPYLDHAATTPLHPDVLAAMLPFFTERFGNASSVHRQGRAARHAVEEARVRVADALGAEPGEIIFTSGGTESDNLALRGLLDDGKGGLVTSMAEHEAVLKTAHALEARGVDCVFLTPDADGAVSAEAVRGAITPQTRLVSLMHVNNETGAVTDLAAVAEVCRAAGVLLHTDAVQSIGHLPVDVRALGVDALSLSGHKLNGPKGVGALYVRSGVDCASVQTGGQQERGRRGGTENVAAIAGLAVAVERATSQQAAWSTHLRALRQRLLGGLRQALGEAFVVNSPAGGAPHILNIAFPPAPRAVDGEMLLLGLDMENVMVSSGSACTSGAIQPSHVLLAMGLDRDTASAALRFSLGPDTTEDEIDAAIAALTRVARRMNLC